MSIQYQYVKGRLIVINYNRGGKDYGKNDRTNDGSI
jgi:hypothetical protein